MKNKDVRNAECFIGKNINVKERRKMKEEFKVLRKQLGKAYRKVEKENTEKICSICFSTYLGFGNNAYPINEGRCCDKCNDLVIIARINKLTKK